MLKRTSPRAFFVSPAVDWGLIGGFSLLCFAVCKWSSFGVSSHQLVAAGFVALVLNWPHFAATNARLYGSRTSIAQYPVTAIAAPLVAGLGVAASLFSPLLIAPVFMKVFMIWSPFHYSGQTVGVSMLYARRSGF